MGRGDAIFLVLAQVVHDAADLARREDALATSVAELPELFLEGLADINPMLQFLPRWLGAELRVVEQCQLCAPAFTIVAHSSAKLLKNLHICKFLNDNVNDNDNFFF